MQVVEVLVVIEDDRLRAASIRHSGRHQEVTAVRLASRICQHC